MTIFDEADFKVQMRQLYREVGPKACARVVMEMLMSASILLSVMKEERERERMEPK
jgi:hypothetical protein